MNRTVAIIAAAMILWASAYAGIRAGLQDYSPFQLAALRYLTASLALAIPAVLSHNMQRPARTDIPRLFLLGITGIAIYNLALNYGEVTVTAGAASFIINTVPVFTVLLSVFLLKERVSRTTWSGAAISFSGVTLIALGEGGEFSLEIGALIILLAAVSASFYNVLQKPLLRKYSAFNIVCYAIWFGTIPMLPFLHDLPERITVAAPQSTLSVFYLGLFPGAIAYWIWSTALSRMDASRAVMFLYSIPPLTLIISFFWLGEIPTWLSLVGGTLAIGGVILVTSQPHKRKEEVQLVSDTSYGPSSLSNKDGPQRLEPEPVTRSHR